ncbi:ALPHA/BETA HYDROLASE RELATED PROTEIN [Salix purpurea]|uniref:ALPHA/BETA HYDROLASE RELATED PROTEIN n=1 Tax=Salix purpurea TaxID=77065 RepID=A0A9Q0ZA59_SALPP|nr:ALPHA/BETA HYDROLASE RELATED PROTEIN [Salix purpurea]
MGFAKEERSKRVLRGVKTLFFLIAMLISFLLFSAPILLAIADTLLPFFLLSASLSPSLSLQTLSSHFSNYDFRCSLVDIPLISIIRSAVIICVYSLCDGPGLSRGPYLGITATCSVSSLIYVSFKAPRVFRVSRMDRGEHVIAMEIALFICSLLLAIGHVAVAYRTSCRERRKLLVYRIDIEAVSLHLPSLSLLLDHDDADDAHIAKL